MQDIVVLASKSTRTRLIVASIVLMSIVGAIFAIRWQLGNMLSSLTRSEDAGAADIAAVGARWAPSDPLGAWLRASIDGDPAAAVNFLEQSVRLAPYDHRWRIELGRALEQDDQLERAETELKKAVELAPEYAYPRWHLGNFYLRRDRVDEAMAELKKAADDNQVYREQVFSLAWDYFARDAASVEALGGDDTDARASLAYFFAARGRAAESLRNWNQLTDDEKASRFAVARSIAHGLYVQRAFPQALEFSRQLNLDPDARPETVTDGSFEKGANGPGDSRFGWEVGRRDPKVEIGSDLRVRSNGVRSLRVTLKGYAKATLAAVFQTVVVEPGRRYRLRFWVRTENLKSAGLPELEVTNANDDKGLVRSAAFPAGTVDWQAMSVEFTAPGNCTAVSIRTVRAFCGDECPVTGTFWYDDFVLDKLAASRP